MHFWNLFVVTGLIAIAYSYPTPILPAFIQNHLVVAYLLLMFTVIPTPTNQAP